MLLYLKVMWVLKLFGASSLDRWEHCLPPHAHIRLALWILIIPYNWSPLHPLSFFSCSYILTYHPLSSFLSDSLCLILILFKDKQNLYAPLFWAFMSITAASYPFSPQLVTICLQFPTLYKALLIKFTLIFWIQWRFFSVLPEFFVAFPMSEHSLFFWGLFPIDFWDDIYFEFSSVLLGRSF